MFANKVTFNANKLQSHYKFQSSVILSVLFDYRLSQSAPGLDCGCQEAQFGRDHGCIMKTVRLYY